MPRYHGMHPMTELWNVSEKVTKKILLNPNTSKISRKFLSDGAEVLALPLKDIINLLIK